LPNHPKDKPTPVVWGQALDKRKFTMLVPGIANGKPLLYVLGAPYSSNSGFVPRTKPLEVTKALEKCVLIVLMGCDGTTRYHARAWQRWVAAASGNPPLVLGWWGAHYMPRDDFGESFSTLFWQKLGVLSASNGNADLATLCTRYHEQVIHAWAGNQGALREAFANSTHCQRHLWYDEPQFPPKKGACRPVMPKGAGAFAPDDSEWRVTTPSGPIHKV
jgi:hypothetical protein